MPPLPVSNWPVVSGMAASRLHFVVVTRPRWLNIRPAKARTPSARTRDVRIAGVIANLSRTGLSDARSGIQRQRRLGADAFGGGSAIAMRIGLRQTRFPRDVGGRHHAQDARRASERGECFRPIRTRVRERRSALPITPVCAARPWSALTRAIASAAQGVWSLCRFPWTVGGRLPVIDQHRAGAELGQRIARTFFEAGVLFLGGCWTPYLVMDARRDFGKVYAACEPAVRAFVLRRIGPDGVDDVVSEVFLAAWRRHGEFLRIRCRGFSISRVAWWRTAVDPMAGAPLCLSG